MTVITMHRPNRPPAPQIQAPQIQARRTQPARIQLARVRPVRLRTAGPVRLTGRGRVAVLTVLVLAGLVLVTALGGLRGPAAAGTSVSHPQSRVVVVQPGQTLWQIAGQVAPNADRRDTIERIVELNALSSTAVSAGARIAVPSH